MPAALVVGPQSMLGSRLIEQLRVDRWQVFTAGRSQGCNVAIDLGSGPWDGAPLPFKADALFHCASAFGDDGAEGRWLNERVNALGAHQVVDLARAARCTHVIYAGSVSSCWANSPLELTSYGASKARAEEILHAGLHSRQIGFASIRFSQLYDERGDCVRHQLWFGRIVAYAHSGSVLRMPGGESLRNLLHVKDAVRVVIAAAEKRLRGIVVASHPCAQSYRATADCANRVFGNGGHVEIAAEKQPFRSVLIPAPSPAVQDLSVLPFIDLREGLEMIRDGGHAHRFGPMDVD